MPDASRYLLRPVFLLNMFNVDVSFGSVLVLVTRVCLGFGIVIIADFLAVVFVLLLVFVLVLVLSAGGLASA